MYHIELGGSGVSTQGSYHCINQDSFLVLPYGDGWMAVVSDGMGSKKLSHYGSKQICQSLYDVVANKGCPLKEMTMEDILIRAHVHWKKRIKEAGYCTEDCGATLLVCIVEGNHMKLARYGDGLISVYLDRKVLSFFDDKSVHYLNETVGLGDILFIKDIEMIELDFTEFYGALLSTDGIEISPMKKSTIETFTKEIIWECVGETTHSFCNKLKFWIDNWVGSDDKTLAYIVNKEYIDE